MNIHMQSNNRLWFLENGVRLSMQSVKIEPGCISCGSCEYLAPEVFKVIVTSQVKTGIDYKQFEEKIRNAALKCPVQVIKIKE